MQHQITLSNRHPVQVTVLFEDCCFRWNEWKVIRSSHQWYFEGAMCVYGFSLLIGTKVPKTVRGLDLLLTHVQQSSCSTPSYIE